MTVSQRLLIPEQLKPQAKSILATLVMAREWKERFPGGWVTNDQLADCAREFFSRDHDTVTRALSRAASQFARLTEPVTVEKSHVSGSRREQRRLQGPLPATIRTWFYREGRNHLYPDTYREFESRIESRLPLTQDLYQVEVSSCIAQGDYEEALRLARSLEHRSQPKARFISLQLTCAILVHRGSYLDLLEAAKILPRLAQEMEMTSGQIRPQVLLLQAECDYWLHVYYEDDSHRSLKQAHALSDRLESLAALITEAPLRLKSRFHLLEGQLLLAQVECPPFLGPGIMAGSPDRRRVLHAKKSIHG